MEDTDLSGCFGHDRITAPRVLDNLGSHKGDAARKAIRAAGARMIFMPPYSPDLNPITECSRNPGSTGAWILSRMP
ncbi:hypothetical protein CIW82_05510 [Acetobacter tropicalis]|uniref:Tc1-like transposase DDE domain-containing protein n=1 Tax=Acetobacter tropicalis TaxID=104102 RepID=A0A291PFS8_9PROT|nr:hypothetical protein CIW82_05510 [Acetobacter tropicalis]